MRTAVTGLAALALLLTACGSDDSGPAKGRTASDLPTGGEEVTLNPGSFSTTVDNPYFPLEPGTRWRYRETGDEGTFDVVVTVSSETTRLANGVEARVVRDTVSQDGELVEDTFDWFAQDADGTVWYLGEDTAELEDGRITSTEGSFEAGVDGAQAGVIMPADPQPGDEYRQEYLEGEAEDAGAVLAVGEMADVPAGHYDDLLLTRDTTPIEPDVLEHKLYAPGVGLVLTLGISGGTSRESLLDVRRVSEAEAREAGTRPLGRPQG